MSRFTIDDLADIIRQRAQGSAGDSYTRKLLDKGAAHCARKMGEEAVETVIAAMAQSDERLASEAADVMYHLLVLLEVRKIDFSDVLRVLEKRKSKSGLEEKAGRAK